MGNQAVFRTADGAGGQAAALLGDTGAPSHNRRLADKILAAFNHAYSIGEKGVAEKLRELLAQVETAGPAQGRSKERRSGYAARQAALWVRFVEARDRYREAIQPGRFENGAAAQALDEMKEAYKDWSTS
jgi:hypothetical protein